MRCRGGKLKPRRVREIHIFFVCTKCSREYSSATAGYTRPLMYPESRTRVRGQITCPRCRVDPSHISRQYWEATRPPPTQVQGPMDIGLGAAASSGPSSAPPELLHRSIGYPDLCPRPGVSAGSTSSFRHHQTSVGHPQQTVQAPVAVAVHQPRPSPASVPQQQPLAYYTQQQHQATSTLPRQQPDNRLSTGTRSGGETWRIRGVFDSSNHVPPDVVHRRTESNPGPLPDVTKHSFHQHQHSTPSMRMMPSSYDTPPAPSMPRSATSYGRYTDSTPTSTRNRSFTATGSLRDHAAFRRSELSGNERRSIPLHQRPSVTEPQNHLPNQQTSGPPSVSPWITRGQQQQLERPIVPYHSGNANNTTSTTANNGGNNTASSASTNNTNSSNSNNNNHHHNNNSSNNSVSVNNDIVSQATSSCWRSSVLSTPLSQCPLPDLVTPRRQARKQCCGILATHSITVRWLVIVVASLGLLCSIVGTVVGVVRASGKEHLSVALLLIGLGIVLVTMSGFAWRLTARDAPSCRAMFGFRRARSEPHRRFVPRVPHYGRPHPFSAMLYPDIPLRPPPPSYQASMQEYRLRLLLMDRPQMPTPPPPPPQHPPPPPPTYRGPATVYPRFSLNIGPSDYSRPPSYRSRPPSSVGQPSPIGPEDTDLNNSTSDHHLHNNNNNNSSINSVVVSADIVASHQQPVPSNVNTTNNSSPNNASTAASGANVPNIAVQNSQAGGRLAPSGVNHVEVVAQV